MPDAVQVSTMVYVVATPEEAIKLEKKGKLLYICFGISLHSFPVSYASEPLGEYSGTYVQDLSWLRVGWLYGTRPEGLPFLERPWRFRADLLYRSQYWRNASLHTPAKLRIVLLCVAQHHTGQYDVRD